MFTKPVHPFVDPANPANNVKSVNTKTSFP